MKLTKENTSKLQQLNQFCREKQQLETKLASLKNDLVSHYYMQVWDCSEMGKGSSGPHQLSGLTSCSGVSSSG